jgi:hypothetical protein
VTHPYRSPGRAKKKSEKPLQTKVPGGSHQHGTSRIAVVFTTVSIKSIYTFTTCEEEEVCSADERGEDK